jgi:hypothetical protein
MGIPTLYSVGPASGTYTATPTANRLGVYMYAGGGGRGGTNNSGGGQGGTGGAGGFGFYNKPITQPFAQPYSVGAGGNAGPEGGGGGSYPAGNAGGASTIANVGTVNGGAGGNGSADTAPGNTGAVGNAPGASLTYPTRSFTVGGNFGLGSSTPSIGTGGVIVVFENTGT